MAITWTDNLPASATVMVEVSRDGGSSFQLVAAAVPNTGSLTWVASGPDTAQALVRVTASGPVVAVGLSGAFGIVTPAVTVTGPAAGAVVFVGTPQTITWTDNLPSDATMLVELSRDGGNSFETLAAAAPNTRQLRLDGDRPAAAAALVRVTGNEPAADQRPRCRLRHRDADADGDQSRRRRQLGDRNAHADHLDDEPGVRPEPSTST